MRKLYRRRDEPGLVEVLAWPKAQLRRQAAECLGDLKDPRSFEPLVAALHDQDVDVRIAAAHALGHSGDARAPAVLLEAAMEIIEGGSEHREAFRSAREAAIYALGDLGDSGAESLARISVNPLYSDSTALSILSQLGIDKAAAALATLPRVRVIVTLMQGCKHFKEINTAPELLARILDMELSREESGEVALLFIDDISRAGGPDPWQRVFQKALRRTWDAGTIEIVREKVESLLVWYPQPYWDIHERTRADHQARRILTCLGEQCLPILAAIFADWAHSEERWDHPHDDPYWGDNQHPAALVMCETVHRILQEIATSDDRHFGQAGLPPLSDDARKKVMETIQLAEGAPRVSDGVLSATQGYAQMIMERSRNEPPPEYGST